MMMGCRTNKKLLPVFVTFVTDDGLLFWRASERTNWWTCVRERGKNVIHFHPRVTETRNLLITHLILLSHLRSQHHQMDDPSVQRALTSIRLAGLSSYHKYIRYRYRTVSYQYILYVLVLSKYGEVPGFNHQPTTDRNEKNTRKTCENAKFDLSLSLLFCLLRSLVLASYSVVQHK